VAQFHVFAAVAIRNTFLATTPVNLSTAKRQEYNDMNTEDCATVLEQFVHDGKPRDAEMEYKTNKR
jgi:hypothetical protein